MGENILRQLQLDLVANSAAYRPNRPALHFSPNDPIGSRQNWRPSWKLSMNNRRTAIIFIGFLAYFPEAKLSSTSPSSMFWKHSKIFYQQPENIQRLFINNPKISKDFFACKIVLAANHQHPEIFKDFFACKIILTANHQHPEILKDFFACQIVWAANHQHPKISKNFFACKIVLAANHQHPKIFKDFFACKIILAANHQHPKKFKDFFACKIVLAANHQHPKISKDFSSTTWKYPKTFSPAKLS